MIRIIFGIILAFSFANSCALCALYTPTAHASIKFIKEDNKIKSLEIRWEFSKNFTETLLASYDENANKKIDKDEMMAIESAFLDYLSPREYLTEISFYDSPNGDLKKISIQPEDFFTDIKNEQLVFIYEVPIYLPIQKNRILKISFFDKEEFFNFKILEDKKIQISNDLWIVQNANLNLAYYEIKSLDSKLNNEKMDYANSGNLKEKNFLAEIINKFLSKLKDLLYQSSKDNSFVNILWLLFISFAYGFFHAAAPGHGKALTAGYFLASGGDWKKALLVSLRIGVIHVIGAVILVAISMFVIKTFVSKFIGDVSVLSTKFAAIVIILLSIVMLVGKLKSKMHHHQCHCASCQAKHDEKEWAVSFIAGIVPCPGTIVVFILAFTLGSYLAGFLSAVAMALGMSTVIFISGILAQSLNKVSSNSNIIRNIVEFLAIFMMMALGVLTYVYADGVL